MCAVQKASAGSMSSLMAEAVSSVWSAGDMTVLEAAGLGFDGGLQPGYLTRTALMY
jgi:hypothetical protein